ncbi:MAG: hypothetical protein RMJ15_07060 [Nitrososphaerota archaeon]|nr:hypothetical protein [Candidatus Bathyarchaeota archaeon]MDW8023477.1 hypothetical protein [Nitrososphaerota archaeon]
MSTKKPKLYEPVEPPKIVKAKRVLEYDELIKSISNEPKGWYKINIPNRKPSTVYVALAKRLKGRTDLKLHFINKVVYIEKL